MPLFGAPGERLGYEVYGSGPALVLLHGFTASSASFLSNIPELAEHFTVITVDLLGHGASDVPGAVEPYTPEAAIARLEALLDHLGLEQVFLCGHSLGGALALRFALDLPGRVAGLVVINSNSAAGPPAWRETAQANLGSMAARVRAEGTGFLRDSRLYPARSSRLPLAAREQLTANFDALQPDGIAGTAEGLVARVNAYERIPELAVPTLIVAGDRDGEFMTNLPGFVERIPAGVASVVVLEGAGHSANLEQPDRFNSELIRFATELGYVEPLPPPAESGGGGGPRLSLAMTAGGIALVAIGFGFLAAAALVDRGDSNPQAAPVVSETVDQVAGESTNSPGATATAANPGIARTATAPPTTEGTPESPSATPTTAPSNASADPDDPTPAPTEDDSSPQPTDPPPPTATAPPTQVPTEPPTVNPGPYAAISGPSALGVGEVGTWRDVSSVGSSQVLIRTWSNGSQGTTYSASFGAPGCYSVGLTIVLTGGASYSASVLVSVGGATC